MDEFFRSTDLRFDGDTRKEDTWKINLDFEFQGQQIFLFLHCILLITKVKLLQGI